MGGSSTEARQSINSMDAMLNCFTSCPAWPAQEFPAPETVHSVFPVQQAPFLQVGVLRHLIQWSSPQGRPCPSQKAEKGTHPQTLPSASPSGKHNRRVAGNFCFLFPMWVAGPDQGAAQPSHLSDTRPTCLAFDLHHTEYKLKSEVPIKHSHQTLPIEDFWYIMKLQSLGRLWPSLLGDGKGLNPEPSMDTPGWVTSLLYWAGKWFCSGHYLLESTLQSVPAQFSFRVAGHINGHQLRTVPLPSSKDGSMEPHSLCLKVASSSIPGTSRLGKIPF